MKKLIAIGVILFIGIQAFSQEAKKPYIKDWYWYYV